MNGLRQVIMGSGLVLGMGSAHAVEISGNVNLATDYVYRGISQTDEEATIQGGFDLSADNGFYAGVWASNIAFDGSVEVDYYLGFGNEVSDSFSYDVGAIHYDYPNQDPLVLEDSDFDEIYLNFSFKDLTLGVAYSNDFFGETGKATYYSLDYELSLPNDFGVGLHYGSQDIDAADDYEDYSVSVSKSFSEIDFALAWHDTDISSCDICESRVVLSMSKSL